MGDSSRDSSKPGDDDDDDAPDTSRGIDALTVAATTDPTAEAKTTEVPVADPSDSGATQQQPAQRGSRPSHPSRPSNPSQPQISQSPSRASVPPSEPRSTSRASFSALDVGADRPARLQMIVALLLGLVLVAIPLYLWRRPRAESIAASGTNDAGIDPNAAAAPPVTTSDDAKPTFGEVKSILCQDPGPKKTSPEACDHVVEVEKALTKAIEESASCAPKSEGGGTIQYVADVSFKRKAINVQTPKDTRTMKNAKVVSACQSAVRGKLQALALDSVKHEHARYKIAVTASYAGAIK